MKTLKLPLKEKYQMNILFLNINSIQILIILFSIMGQVKANEFPCGDVDPEVYLDGSYFVVQYHNTKTGKILEDKFKINGELIHRRNNVPDSISNKRINQGFSGSIPTGKSSPLGDYGIPKALSICFYKDSILYSILGPSIPDNIKNPFLEIKERTNPARKINFKWCRKGFDFQRSNLFIDGKNVVGTLSSPEQDTLYIFRTTMGDSNCVKFKIIAQSSKPRHPYPNTTIRDYAHATQIKKYKDFFVVVCADSTDKPKISFWNYKNDQFKIKAIPVQAIKVGSFPADFNIIDDNILLAWVTRKNQKDYCSTSIIETSCKIMSNE
jgi:hypothetical protein